MDACCEAKEQELRTLRGKQKGVLTLVLVINAVLFIVEAAAGLLAHSTALLADSLRSRAGSDLGKLLIRRHETVA